MLSDLPLPTLDAVQAEKARRRLADFVPYMWDVLEPGNPLVGNWHIDAICEHLEAVTAGEINRLIINIPPGCMKSWIVSVAWPAWNWLQDPTWKAVFVSYTLQLSSRDSSRCRDLVQSDKYERIKEGAGLDWELARAQNVKTYFKNTQQGERLALTIGGQATGFRGDAIVVDDPHLIEAVPNVEKWREVCEWYDKVLSTRLNDQENGAKVLIQQRVGEMDLTGHLIEKYGDQYEKLILPMEFDPDRRARTVIFTDPREEPGELLFPEKFPQKVVDRLKQELETEFAGQYNQLPASSSGEHFRGDHFRFWYPPGIPEPPPVRMMDPETEEMVDCFQMPLDIHSEVTGHMASWDCAFKDTTGSDFVCGTTWARLKGKRAHGVLLDRSYGRKSFTATVEAVRDQLIKWPKTSQILIEEAANGHAVIDSLKGHLPGLKGIKPEGGKVSRANAILPMFEAGQVWFPHPAVFPWVQHYMSELLKFPRAAHDDQVDSTTQALIRLKKRVVILMGGLDEEILG